MLKCLYTLSPEYNNAKIIVFGVNRDSVITFSRLALNYQADVSYFWDPDDHFTGESFANRIVISTGQVKRMQGAVIIVPETTDKNEAAQYMERKDNVFYMDEILDINSELYSSRIYIYGIGKYGGMLYDKLTEKNITVEGVCVTRLNGVEKWHGYQVLSVDQIEDDSGCAVIIATENMRFQKEMLACLENRSMEKYISCFMEYETIFQGNLFQVINIAVETNKNIWMYVCKDEPALFLNEVFERYQINLYRRIYGDEIYELAYEDVDNTCVVVAGNDEQAVVQICDVLDDIGFGLEQWNYTATEHYTFRSVEARKQSRRDMLIGDSIYVNEKYPGYTVYGDEKKAGVKIMILGGSTSTDGIYRTVSWVSFLYKKLREAGCDPFILNGSICAHGIVNEFLHMLRDIEPLKPDYVISLSGINDTSYRKAKNLFNISDGGWNQHQDDSWISGIESDESLYDFWCRISKLMNLTAKMHGAKMYHFLQPMSAAKDKLDFIETGIYDFTKHTEHMRNFKSRARKEKDKFYVDMVSMFEEKTAFIDYLHYSTESNRRIADVVFEVIAKDILER